MYLPSSKRLSTFFESGCSIGLLGISLLFANRYSSLGFTIQSYISSLVAPLFDFLFIELAINNVNSNNKTFGDVYFVKTTDRLFLFVFFLFPKNICFYHRAIGSRSANECGFWADKKSFVKLFRRCLCLRFSRFAITPMTNSMDCVWYDKTDMYTTFVGFKLAGIGRDNLIVKNVLIAWGFRSFNVRRSYKRYNTLSICGDFDRLIKIK